MTEQIKQHLLTARREVTKALVLLETPVPPPPPPPPFKKDDRLHFGGTFFLWFLYKAWKIENQAEVIDEARKVLNKFASYGYAVDEALGWIWSGRGEHRHLDGKCPWKKKLTSGANLDKNELRYYQLWRTFVRLHREVGIELEYCIIMRDDYTRKAIRWHDENKWNYLRALGRNICRMYREAYKDVNYKPMIKIANELMHSGSTSTFHLIGRLHFNIANHLMDRGDTTIDKIKCDLSLSEGGQIYLNEPLPCGKCGQIHGDPFNQGFDRADPKKSILAEKHGYGCLKNITENPDALKWLGSKWKRYELSGDGGAYPYTTQGFHIPGTNFYQGSPDDMYKLVKYYMQKCKDYKKMGVYCLWLMEIYNEKHSDNNNWKEHWEMDVIDWDRVEATAKGCKEIKA